MKRMSEVAYKLSDDWFNQILDRVEDQLTLEEAMKLLTLRMAIWFEMSWGDEARVSLAQLLRDAADEIDQRTGEMMLEDRKRRREAA